MRIKRILKLALTSLMLFASYGVIASAVVHAAPVTFTVTNTNDSGAGSLRQALDSANANNNPGDQDSIEFNISGNGPHKISPSTNYDITEPVLIDGYSQNGANQNTTAMPNPLDFVLKIVIDNSGAAAIEVYANNVTLRGLVINKSPANGEIRTRNVENFKLIGSIIELDATGLDSGSGGVNTSHISILGSSNAQIGGSAPEDRNVLGRCAKSCIFASAFNGQDSDGLIIRGNNIGIGADSITYQGGDTPYASGAAIMLRSGANSARIGGSNVGEGNLIDRNRFGAIDAEDVNDLRILGNRITNNYLQWDENREKGIVQLKGITNSRIGSSGDGRNILAISSDVPVLFFGTSSTNQDSYNVTVENNHIGVINNGSDAVGNTNSVHVKAGQYITFKNNVIKNSMYGAGIDVFGTANKVSILGNSIYDNALPNSGLGIDVGSNNVTSNDAGDSDTGPNDLLNFPLYNDVQDDGSNTTIGYSLDAPAGDYRIEFFANTNPDQSGYGEGQTYLGSAVFTSTGGGEEFASTVLNDIGFQNIALTATQIDSSSPNGFGSTSEFSPNSPGNPSQEQTDIGVTKVLANPEDIAPGAVLNYTINITNHGPAPFDISELDNSSPGQNSIVTDILPPEFDNFIGNSNSDISCGWLGPESAGAIGAALANHANYSVIFCGFTGGSKILQAGDSLDFTISVQLSNSAGEQFTNYAFTPSVANDPDAAVSAWPFTPGSPCYDNGLTDVIDCYSAVLINEGFNNFALGAIPTDLSVEKTLLNPNDVAPGNTISYKLSLANNGSTNVDLSQYDTANNGLMADIFPGDDLQYVNDSTDDISCDILGPASILGPATSNHPNHEALSCYATGTNQILQPGQKLEIQVNFEVQSGVHSAFTNYAFHYSNLSYSDPDVIDIAQQFFGSNVDVLDTFQNDNYAKYTYTASSPVSDTDGDGSSDASENTGPNNGDANNDGLQDSQQANVATFVNPVTNKYAALSVSNACSITVVEQASEQALSKKDDQFSYPLGLMNFVLTCNTPGYIASITQYYFDETNPGYILRKYFPVAVTYDTIQDASVSTQQIGGRSAVVASYQITDGGKLDLDGSANGTIVDPAGLAIKASGSLSATGRNIIVIIFAALIILLTSTSILFTRRYHSRVQ